MAQKSGKDTARSLDPTLDLYRSAVKLIDSLHYKEALKILEKVTKKKPDYPEAYNKMAYCYMQMKNFSKATKYLQLSVKYKPDNFDCIKLLGRACYLNHQYDSAKKNYASAEKIDPTDPELMCYIAELRTLGKDIKGAIEIYNQVLIIRENYALAYLNRGLLKYLLQQYSYSVKDLETGINLFKFKGIDDTAYSTLALGKFMLGDFAGARKAFDTLCNRNPKNEFALTYRGAARIEIDDFSGAIEDESLAIKLNSKSFLAYTFRGTAKGGLKQFVEALKDFETSLKIKFNYPPTYVNRAAVRMASKDRKGACEDLNKADQLGSDVAYKLIQQYCGDPDY